MKRILFVVNTVFLKLKFRKKLIIDGIQKISNRVSITIKRGKIELGKRVALSEGVHLGVLEGNIKIGNNVFFNRNCVVASRKHISIGANCSFGPNVVIYDHDHKFDIEGVKHTEYNTASVVIGDNCWVGAGAIILRDTCIGEGCVIGAGTVVKGNVPPHTIVVNNRELLLKEIVEKR